MIDFADGIPDYINRLERFYFCYTGVKTAIDRGIREEIPLAEVFEALCQEKAKIVLVQSKSHSMR
ncbi:MAG: hypothetical protein ACYCQI_07645 [Gammaproteobacteria bacterium]